MDITQDVDKLKRGDYFDKLQMYPSLIRKISDLREKCQQEFLANDVDVLFSEIVHDLNSDNKTLIETLLIELKLLMRHDLDLKQFFSEDQQRSILKGVINLIKIDEEERLLLLYFSHLDYTSVHVNLEKADIEDLLNKIAEVLSKKTIPLPVYIEACSFIQRFFKEKEETLSNCMHIIPKLIFLPLSHSSGKVRDIAEKTLDSFPRLVIYSEDSVASGVLLKNIKEPYCKELILLMKYKLEHYVLKVWKEIVNALGKGLHCNLPAMTPFFQVIEKGFKSPSDDVCKAAFLTWKDLISNFALDDDVLNDSKKLRFVLKPFRNISKFNETVSSTVCDTWWHLVWSLTHNLSSRFTEVCLPLLEYTFGKSSCAVKENQIFLVKIGCQILLRLLEQPPNASFGRISSPKKLPPLTYPSLHVPLNIKVIARHFREILSMLRTIIEAFGNNKDMTNQLDCLMKSVLFVVSSVIDDNTKDSVDAVVLYISLVSDITESRLCPSSTCLKCIDTLSKLPKSALVSHCFNCGIRKPQDILCMNLLKLLFNPYLLSNETTNKRYLPSYNRLIQAGICESQNPLLMAQKFINLLKSVILPDKHTGDFLYELWSGIASPLLASIEKTQEVNQGDKNDHDFTCLYSVLLCPFESMFPTSVPQLRAKPVFQTWTNLYKIFIRCSELVSTTLPNETSEHFCARLKSIINEEELKDPQNFENFCHLVQVVLESVDFTALSSTSQGLPSMLTKKKRPLGNLMSLVDLLALMLSSFYTNFVDLEEEVYHSCTPKAQKRGHVSKTAMPLDVMKIFFQNLKSGSIIPFVLEKLIQPLSKYFSTSQKKVTNVVGTKLEALFNTLMSSIEMYYLGPYDTDFLSLMSPLLEACFGHFKRQIKERCRRFWFATFAPVSSSLKFSESLKNVMKKTKLPLMPGENISPMDEFSITPGSGNAEDCVVNFETLGGLKDTIEQPREVSCSKEAKATSTETVSVGVKEKTSNKINVDELPSSEFVKIDSPCRTVATPRRRSVRMRKSFVPALYNDLSQSQDTTTLGGSSESIDNSCEIMECKSQEDFIKPSTLSKKADSIEEEKDIPLVTLSADNEQNPKGESSVEEIHAKKVVPENIKGETDNTSEVNSNHQENESVSGTCLKDFTTKNDEQILNEDISSSDGIEIIDFQETKNVDLTLSDDKDLPSTPASKKGMKKPLQGRQKTILSQFFSVQSPKRALIEHSHTNQSCIDIIDLDDSEEIIPSSQSSCENESKQLLTVDNSSGIGFNTSVKAKNTELPISLSISSPIPSPTPVTHRLTLLETENVCEECPETSADLMGSSPEGAKEPDVGVQGQELAPSVEGSSAVMPLKSSENLLSCEEPTKADSQEIKAVLSDILKTSEANGQNVAENTPPLFDDVFVVQSALLETEAKPIPYTESMSLNVELQNASEMGSKLDGSKITRAKSARIATRKSLDCVTGKKKIVKKATKRKSMANVTEVKSKSGILDDIEEALPQDDKTIPSSSYQLDSSSDDKELQMPEKFPGPVEDSSLIDEITSVLSDIKEKLELESEPNSFDEFSLGQTEKHSNQSSYVRESFNQRSGKPSCNSKRKDLKKRLKVTSLPMADSEEKCEIDEDMDEIPGTQIQDAFSRQSASNTANKSSEKVNNDTQNFSQDSQCASDKQDVPISECKSAERDQDPEKQNIDSIKENTPNLLPENQDMKKQCLLLNANQTDMYENANGLIKLEKEASNTSEKILNNEVLFDDNSCAPKPDETCTKPDESISGDEIKSSPVISPAEVTISDISNLNEVAANEDLGSVDVKSSKDLNRTSEVIVDQDFIHSQSAVELTLKPDFTNNSYTSPKDDFEELGCFQYPPSNTEMCSQDNKEMIGWLMEQASETDTGTVHSEELVKKYTFIPESSESVNSRIIHSYFKGGSLSDDTEIQSTPKMEFKTFDLERLVGFGSTPELMESDVFETMSYHEQEKSCEMDPLAWNESGVISESIMTATDVTLNVISSHIASASTSSTDMESDCLDGTESDKCSVKEISDETSESKKVGSSRKRKTKCPVRSPFNFRQRLNVLVPMVPKQNPEIPAENKSIKRTIHDAHKKPTEGAEKKIKVSLFNSKDKSQEKSLPPVGNTSLPSSSLASSDVEAQTKKTPESSQTSKAKINFDEITSVNTRYNANMATLTRRLKQHSTLQQSVDLENGAGAVKEESTSFESVICSSSVISNSILRKRKSSESTSSKLRRVTFSDPLYEQRVFYKDKRSSFREPIPDPKQAKEKVSKVTTPTSLLSTEEFSSHEFENSDILADYSNLPVSSLLVDCKVDVSDILSDLAASAWVRALESLLQAKHIKTIGDLCKLNIHELKALPLSSPKVLNLHRILLAHLDRMQKDTLEKLKTIDDWGSGASTSKEEADTDKVKESPQDNDVNMEENSIEVVKCLAEELLCDERIKHLPTNILVSLSEKCFAEVTKRLKDK